MTSSNFKSLAVALLGAAFAMGVADVPAQTTKPGGAIFTCTTAAGRTLTADRPIAQCLDREQRVLNSDGSLRTILQPSLTSDERASLEEAERKKMLERSVRQDAIRRDRNLLTRYPDEAAHAKGREAALDTVRASMAASEQRVVALQKERKPLMDETEFYKGKALPPKLKAQIDAVDVSIEAQHTAQANQRAEMTRINGLFDAELARLKLLWGGAEPGSLGPLPMTAQAAAPTPGR